MPQENDIMSNPTEPSTFIEKVFQNDAAKKGFAAAAAGILVAIISETVWPSS
jgi:hypothetical protein